MNTTFNIVEIETEKVLATQISKKTKMTFSFEAEFSALKKRGKRVVVLSWKDGDKEAKVVRT